MTNITEKNSPSRNINIKKKVFVILLFVIAFLIVSFGIRVFLKAKKFEALQNNLNNQAIRYVTTITPNSDNSDNKIELPGSLQGFVESPIYARTNGYLIKWYKDIGSKVNKGDLLAELDTPEIDQQLNQAIATRQQAQASLELAKSSMERWDQLRQRDVVSQQELDERKSAYDQAHANLAAASAEVQRLNESVSFKKIVAPFSGTITKRNVDVGDLISVSNTDSAHALFTLSQTDKLKLYVDVPQTYAEKITVGQQVSFVQTEMPNQNFVGKIDRTAKAIDINSRTMQVEIILDNHDGRLLPGAYVNVSLPIKSQNKLTIPSNTLLFRSEGASVAILENGNRVKIKAIKIGQDYGKTIEVLDGVGEKDQLILNPSDSLDNGDIVSLVASTKK